MRKVVLLVTALDEGIDFASVLNVRYAFEDLPSDKEFAYSLLRFEHEAEYSYCAAFPRNQVTFLNHVLAL